MAAMHKMIKVATRLESRIAASLPLLCRVWVKVATKAEERAPSAKRSRSRLGMRKAAKNASYCRPAPKKIAKT